MYAGGRKEILRRTKDSLAVHQSTAERPPNRRQVMIFYHTYKTYLTFDATYRNLFSVVNDISLGISEAPHNGIALVKERDIGATNRHYCREPLPHAIPGFKALPYSMSSPSTGQG